MMRLHTSAAVASLLFGCASAPTATPARPEPVRARAAERTEERTDDRREPAAESITVTGLAPVLPRGTTSFGMAVTDDGTLYVLGGFRGEPHNYLAEGQSPDLHRLRPGADHWEAAPGLEAGIQSVALVPFEGALHRVGGMRVGEPNQLHSVAEHARFDPESGEWTAIAPLPEARSSHEALALGDSIVVVGGWALDGDRSEGRFAETMLRYREGRWEASESPVRRRAVGAAASDDTLVVAGGLTPSGDISQRVDVYDADSGEWSRAPDLPGERTGFGVALAFTGDAFVASGMDGTLWRWAPGDAAWTRAGELRFPRFFHRMAKVGEELFVVGGIGGMHTTGRTRVVERLAADGSRPAIATAEVPWPGRAKNRQGMFVVGDHLYFFGGNDSLEQHDFDAERFQTEGWRIHLPSLAIEPRAAYPFPRQTMAVRVVEQDGEASVLVAGGFGHEPVPEGAESVARTQRELYRYDVAADRFVPGPDLPVSRTQMDMVQAPDGSILVLGGLDYDPAREQGDHFRHLVEIAHLAPDAAAFTALDTPLPEPRRAFAAGTLGGTHYLVGGMKDGFQLVDSCTRFDLSERTFAPFTCPERPRLSGEIVAVGAHLALVGGTAREAGDAAGDAGLTEVRHIERYDPESDQWETLAPELPFSPRHARAFAYRGGVLLVSTHNEDGALRLAFIDVAEPRR
ncbi:MAG: hypothetical protein JJ863_32675 [Deltaproteobacteria bacterium]|nr:hypothetical protein [Deltaproteobacteria bacterium]